MDPAVTDRWLFIPAAGPQAGLGHLRRCAALERLAPAAIAHPEASLLPPAVRRLQWAEIIPEQQVSWVILDGYTFDVDDQRALQATGRQLLVLDDQHHLSDYAADLIVNPNAGADALIYRGAPLGRRLQGADYALIASDMVQLRPPHRDAPQLATRLIVLTGGGDPHGVRATLGNAIQAVERESLDVTIVVGPFDSAGDDLVPRDTRHRWSVVRDPVNLPQLMNDAHLAISTAGVTLAELACLGVPTIAIVAADNQARGAAALAKAGAIELAGNAETLAATALTPLITRLIGDRGRRQELTENAQRTIDGDGARRVARAIRDLTIRLRRATLDDLQQLFTWVNDPAVRRASFRSAVISLSEHTQWFQARLDDPASTIYIASNADGQPLGMARFERAAQIATISVSVAAEFRGTHRGTRLIDLACRRYFFEHDTLEIIAQIKPDNEASYRAFRNVGFQFTSESQLHGQTANTLRLSR